MKREGNKIRYAFLVVQFNIYICEWQEMVFFPAIYQTLYTPLFTRVEMKNGSDVRMFAKRKNYGFGCKHININSDLFFLLFYIVVYIVEIDSIFMVISNYYNLFLYGRMFDFVNKYVLITSVYKTL